MNYLLSPYVREDDAQTPARKVALASVLFQDGIAQPFREVEILGGLALCLVEDPALAVRAAAVPGVEMLPLPGNLTRPLGDLTSAQQRRLREVVLERGYTPGELRTAIGPDLAAVPFVKFIRFLASRRLKPRYDRAADAIVLDGPPQPQPDVPLPRFAGGAFGDEPLYDDFNRANGLVTAGAGSSLWTSPAVSDEGNWKIVSNVATKNTAGYDSIRTAASTWGPQVRVWTTVVQRQEDAEFFRLSVRENGSGATFDRYLMRLHRIDSTGHQINIYRTDNGTSTLLGATVTLATGTTGYADGDLIGFEADGTSLKAYTKRGAGAWTARSTRTDSTYTVAGYVSITAGNGSAIDIDDVHVGFDAAATVLPIGQPGEADNAQAFTRRKADVLGQPVVAEGAQAITVVRVRAFGQALEADAAQGITRLKRRGINQPLEVDAAQSLGRIKRKTLGVALETDEARATTPVTPAPYVPQPPGTTIPGGGTGATLTSWWNGEVDPRWRWFDVELDEAERLALLADDEEVLLVAMS